ncbi:tryptophan synthase alpha chain-like [Ylistrum balloti]|uniref:tryptophan synthase alpha chain-like n=1 Tax=Ylistrum balloti TaxID=509963 RepID=UPI002905F0C0|nr:tryptophan synthase alpha chain-like [Ylistrum balloti]
MSKKSIDEVFSKPGLKLMNHVVAGYPNPKMCLDCLQAMEANGTDMVEIQIPFTDPMADGPTIVKANHDALSSGMNVKKTFEWIKEAKGKTQLPLLIMTYYNIPYQMGLKEFFRRAVDCGVSGIIIPDIPFDEAHEHYPDKISSFDLHPILVVSPTTTVERLQKINRWGKGFVYTTLKAGVTGTKKLIDDSSIRFLKQLRNFFSIPIAAGFGIHSPEQAKELSDKVDMVVIGSKVIQILDSKKDPLSFIAEFIRSCKSD